MIAFYNKMILFDTPHFILVLGELAIDDFLPSLLACVICSNRRCILNSFSRSLLPVPLIMFLIRVGGAKSFVLCGGSIK